MHSANQTATTCQWAFLSAIKTFYERVLAEGGNVVVDYKVLPQGVLSKASAKLSAEQEMLSKRYNTMRGVVSFWDWSIAY